jgi:adenosylcobinamide kinase/adenosylcobinamide-phosphate guanylyltransferase
MSLALVTGPVRSGKSRLAERLAAESGKHVVYVATAGDDPDDAAWQTRIALHRERRPAHWDVRETARVNDDLAAVFRDAAADTTYLVDSLGTWLAQRMAVAHEPLHGDDAALERALERDCADVLAALDTARGTVVLVGEEVGWGIVPLAASARIFRDVLGRLHQAIAARADCVYLVVSGLAIDLKRFGTPV